MTELISNFDVKSSSGILGSFFYRYALEKDLLFIKGLSYNGNEFDFTDSVSNYDSHGEKQAVFVLPDETVVWIYLSSGTTYLYVAAPTQDALEQGLEYAKSKAPEEVPPEDNTVSVTFWAHSSQGPISRRRRIEVPEWDEIDTNYNFETYSELTSLMDPDFRPTRGGQLLLWHGPPGTGKTTALRALAREWKGWADLHFITDPERFFGSDADYMMSIMVDQSSETRWRVLVLEDCGELLAKDARSMLANPQALSRFLNAVDGILGQGLKFLVLVTTNEDLGKLHEAVTRPGRCLNQLEFGKLDPCKVREWAMSNEIEVPEHSYSLAELFAIKEDFANKVQSQGKHIGFGI